MVRKKLQYGIYLSILIIIGLVYYFYHPAHYQLFPKCVFKSLTGLSCPGCGGQRAIHELLHLNFRQAFEYNAILVISLPYVFTGLLFNLTNLKERFPKTQKVLFGIPALILVLIIIILFFIFRNL